MSAPLNTLTTGSYSTLEWRQPKTMVRDSELAADDRVIGALTFRSRWGTLATAAIGSACWTFKRVGFLRPRVQVRECGSDDPIAEFGNATWAGGGTLTLRGGRGFRMTTNWWNTKWEVQDLDGRVLLRFDYGGAFRLRAHVKISHEARAQPELPLLVALSWYLVIMLWDDASTAALTG